MSRVSTIGQAFAAVLAESAATTFAQLTVPAGTVLGGQINYTVTAASAAEFQALVGTTTFAIANKAGTLTLTLGTDTQLNANSSGTLTGTLTLVDSTGGVASFQMDAVSSLTQTSLNIRGLIILNR